MEIALLVIGILIIGMLGYDIWITRKYYDEIDSDIGNSFNSVYDIIDSLDENIFVIKAEQEEYAKIILDKLDVMIDVMYDKIDTKFEEHENFIREENNRF